MGSFQPVRIAYNKFEPKPGKNENLAPIIYLHGLTACKEYWNDLPQIVADETKREAYVIDARNHGDSEWSDHWNFDVNADDLIHFMDSRGIQKAILVGHSMGGTTAIKTALKKPESVEKVVIEDMAVRKLSEPILLGIQAYSSIIREVIKLVPPEMDEEEAKQFIVDYNFRFIPPNLKKMRSPNTAAYRPAIALRRDANGRFQYKANMEVIIKRMATSEHIMTESRGKYEGPALFIYGKLSPFKVGYDEDHIKQFFPNVIMKGIEAATHSVHIDKSEEFAEELIKFISLNTRQKL